MMKRVFVVMAAAASLYSCGNNNQSAPGGQPLPVYPTEVVQPGEVVLENVYPVTIRGQVDVEIRPRIDGFIKEIFIDEGSVVRKGQSLFKIDSPAAEQALATAQAAIVSAQSSLNTAKLNVERMRPLAEKNIISRVQLQTYENQYEAAQAALDQANAALVQAQATESWTNVLSPIDGVAGAIAYRQGSLVSSSVVLTTIADTRDVYAYFSINEKELMTLLDKYEGNTQAQKINNMPEVTLTLANGSVYPYKGSIETISGVVNTTTGSVSLRAEFPNRDGILKSGTSGRIAIPRIMQNTVRIPQKATVQSQDKILVYKVQGDSVVRNLITVESTPDGQHYAVTSGLQAGDRIVTDGVATLSEGRKIRVE